MNLKYFLDNLWLWKCGKKENDFYKRFDMNELTNKEWSIKFEKLMRNRLKMGAIRYGKLNDIDKANYDRIKSIIDKLKLYEKKHNKELLVDIANLCLIEFEEGDGYFKATDDKNHTKIKGA